MHEAADLNEIEKEIEEGLQPKEGEDPLTEEEKEAQRKKNKFSIWTKMFYCPE